MTAPDILFIQLDQQRYDCLGRAGHPLVMTPAIDRLADQGMWFSRAYTAAPLCCPARQSLLSGQWPDKHGGLWNYDQNIPIGLFDQPTWTQTLNERGYRLGYVGKWHVHPTKTPLDFGFHDYVGDADYAALQRRENHPASLMDERHWFGGVDPVPLASTRTHWLATRAGDLVQRYATGGRPWHLRFDLHEPHLPCTPRQQFLDRIDPTHIQPWPNFGDSFANKPYIQKQQLHSWELESAGWDQWSRYVHRYLAMTMQVDDAVGQLLSALDQANQSHNTMVIFTSDHGDACGSHGMIDKHYVMYEEEVHVPLIVRWPAVVAPGSTCDAFVNHLIDLPVTLLEAADLPKPDSYDGRSLIPLLRGTIPTDWPDHVVSTYNGQQFGLFNQRMIRDVRWKYVWNLTAVDELYDLQTDPYELTNRISDESCVAVLAAIRMKLYDQLVRYGDMFVNGPARKQLTEGRQVAVEKSRCNPRGAR